MAVMRVATVQKPEDRLECFSMLHRIFRRILEDLELGGVVVSRPIARVRRVQLNPRWFAAKELAALLERLAEGDPRLSELSLQRRAHPRRPSKDR